MEQILSAKKTCEMLSISRATLWRLGKKSLLKPRRLGGKVAYLKSEVEAFIAGLPTADNAINQQEDISEADKG